VVRFGHESPRCGCQWMRRGSGHRRGGQRLTAVVVEGGTATWPRRRAVAHAQREEDEDGLPFHCDKSKQYAVLGSDLTGRGPRWWASAR
jgi:hypothetical protein